MIYAPSFYGALTVIVNLVPFIAVKAYILLETVLQNETVKTLVLC